MKTMTPMQPMKPMEPMRPMEKAEVWWPNELGEPSTTGGQNDVHYAFFPDKHRLLVRQGEVTTTYDSADHQIGGVAQSQSDTQSLTFTSQNGRVDLSQLERV